MSMSEPAQKPSLGLGGIAVLVIVAAYVGLEFSVLHTQRYRAEPLYIHNEFVTANQATLRCGDPDPKVWQRFQSNFQGMRHRALAQLQEATPQAGADELVAQLDSAVASRVGEVNAFIDANGCKHMDVWRWVKLHEVRARLNLR
ncbi:MAG: hypothetical protein AAGI24_17045 [Pseudomonadota bacterium]